MSNSIIIAVAIILIISAIIAAYYINNLRKKKELKERIIAMWGKEPSQKYRQTDMPSIASYYRNLSKNSNDDFIDDITWNDLDMDSVFKRINSTLSSAGEEYLYALLRKPFKSETELSERCRIISLFENSEKTRNNIQLILAMLGKVRSIDITDIFFDDEKISNKRSIIYRILSAIPVLSILVAAFNFGTGISMLAFSFIINLVVYYKAKNDEAAHLETISYIINLLNCSKKITDLKIEGLEGINSKLKRCYSKVKSLNKRSFTILYSTGDPFTEYIKIAFLIELIAYESVISKIHKYRKTLLEIYECIGLLDSLAAIASYRKSLKYWCLPSLTKTKTIKGQKLQFKNIYHPLLKDPVPNSLETAAPVLITGSNASGNSTFLKTVAINAIFAQTICTCLAESYSSPYFKIYSSMALKDNIANKESYYITEIKSLKRIIDNLNDDCPCLCFIDEVLRGTNTVERIAASSQVLYYLSNANCLCIAATHDIELTYILENSFDNYHFRENFNDDEITFDYTLHNGRSNTRNAIKLLKYMGYNESIVNQAEQRAENFIKSGRWEQIN